MPGDIDMILVMRDDFDMRTCDESTKPLFDHIQAAQRFGASLFGSDRGCSSTRRWPVLSRTGN